MFSIGIDLGTSSLKLSCFNENLKCVFSHSVDYEMVQPKIGWAEQDPIFWKQALEESLTRFVKQNKEWVPQVKGIGLTGQMHGLVLLDQEGEVIRPAILWCDQRTQTQVDFLNQTIGSKRLIEETGNMALTGFTLAKLLWIRDNEPENFKRIHKVLLPKDYIRYLLSGKYVTDMSDASGTQLLNPHEREWNRTLIDELNLPQNIFPQLIEGTECSAYLDQKTAQQYGFTEGIPIAGGGGDNEVAAVGLHVIEDGQGFLTIGTSGVIYVHTQAFHSDPKGAIHAMCSCIPNEYHVMGVTQSAGLSLKWLQTILGDKYNYSYLTNLANDVEIGAEGLIYLPYLMGERSPIVDPYARGVFFGLSAKHSKAHMVRAVMEGVAFSILDCKKAMEDLEVRPNTLRITGGGARSDLWCQIFADVLNVSIERPLENEGTTLGAAVLGFAAAGLDPWKKLEELTNHRTLFEPIQKNHMAYLKFFEIYQSIYQETKSLMKKLHQIGY